MNIKFINGQVIDHIKVVSCVNDFVTFLATGESYEDEELFIYFLLDNVKEHNIHSFKKVENDWGDFLITASIAKFVFC